MARVLLLGVQCANPLVLGWVSSAGLRRGMVICSGGGNSGIRRSSNGCCSGGE